jgi:uncharacterized protein (DUF58 family)
VFSKFTVNSVVLLVLTAFTVGVASIFKNPLLVYTAVFLVVTNVALFTWAQLSVAGLRVTRRHPRLAVATRPMTVQIELTNLRRSPRYGTLGFDVHRQLTPGLEYTPVAFLDARPHQPVLAEYTCTPPRRGVFKVGPFYLYGGDPFGFYKCWGRQDVYSQITVVPAPLSFNYSRPSSTSRLRQDELDTIPVSGDSDEFLGVREYIEGEPLKRVHWRTSARIGRLISRQYEMSVAAAVSALVLVDDHMLVGSRIDNPLEYSLTMVASLGYATLRERFQFSYLALVGEAYDSCAGAGRAFYEELAVRLAKLTGYGPVDWENQSRIILDQLSAGSHLVVFIAELNETARARLRHLAAHFRGLTVVTFNQRSFKQGLRPDTAGPRRSFGDGYLVFEVHYGDDLAQVLSECLVRPKLARSLR